jgi:hypothetical protein
MARGNIRFTPGLLTQLGSFGQGPANQQGAAGASMLPPAQQFGPSGLGGMFARNLGTTLGLDMRTPGERLSADIANVPEDDPKRLEKQISLQLQAALRAGDRPTAAKLAGTLEDIKTRQAEAQKLATPKVVGSETEQLKDDKGNRYARVMRVDTLGNPSFELIPLGGAPKVPVGTPQTIGPAGLTSKERLNEAADEAAEIKKAEAWGDQVNNIYAAGFLAVEEIPKLEKVLEIVEDPNFTSGGLADILEDFQEFFGLGSPDVGEFKEYTAEILTQKLDAFTGAISDGERKYLERNLATFERSPGVNARLLRNILEGFEKAKEKALVFADREDSGNPFKRSEWLKFVNNNRFVGANDNDVSKSATREVTLEEMLGN